MPKNRAKPAVTAPSQDDFINAAQVHSSESVELSASQKREYDKLSDEVKQSYPMSAFALMESKSIAQLRTDEDAPRGYKAIALQFNRYEYSRLEEAAEKLGISKNEFMRNAVESACKKTLK